MDDRHRELLHRCLSEFEEDLEPKKVVSKLTTVLDTTDVREIYEGGTRVDQVYKLLDLLPRRGPDAFDVFVKALEPIQPHLTITLKNAEMIMMQEELDKERASSARRINERDETKADLEKEKNEHEETKRTLKEMKSQHQAMMAESAEKYKKEKEDIKKELNIEKARCAELGSKVLEAETALGKEQSKNEEMQREIKELEIKKGNLEAESKAETKRLSGENKSLKKNIKDLNVQLKNLRKKSNEKIELLKKEQESQRDSNEQKVANLTEELKRQESQIIEASEEIEELNNANERLRTASDEEKKKRTKIEEKLRVEAKAKGDALNELAKLKEGSGRVFYYKKDFDKYGVFYWMGSNFRTIAWEHPSSKSDLAKRVISSRSSDREGSAGDLLDHEYTRKKRSCTEAEQESWWRVELSKKYSLYLTHYTLRHGSDNGDSFLRNWRLEGSLDGSTWKVLKVHKNDDSLKKPSSYTATWSVEEETGAFRFFKYFRQERTPRKTMAFTLLVWNCTEYF